MVVPPNRPCRFFHYHPAPGSQGPMLCHLYSFARTPALVGCSKPRGFRCSMTCFLKATTSCGMLEKNVVAGKSLCHWMVFVGKSRVET